ncbi:MAG: hypothetical protein U5L45_03505 [Saprospiraceae bacterium]|nr:hypothetical protein [Saprospiraceae bacterium]
MVHFSGKARKNEPLSSFCASEASAKHYILSSIIISASSNVL